jgi:hypothetical protein
VIVPDVVLQNQAHHKAAEAHRQAQEATTNGSGPTVQWDKDRADWAAWGQ